MLAPIHHITYCSARYKRGAKLAARRTLPPPAPSSCPCLTWRVVNWHCGLSIWNHMPLGGPITVKSLQGAGGWCPGCGRGAVWGAVAALMRRIAGMAPRIVTTGIDLGDRSGESRQKRLGGVATMAHRASTAHHPLNASFPPTAPSMALAMYEAHTCCKIGCPSPSSSLLPSPPPVACITARLSPGAARPTRHQKISIKSPSSREPAGSPRGGRFGSARMENGIPPPRPKRQVKKTPRSDDFIDNYDAELDAIESLPSTAPKPAIVQQTAAAPRKRGRPRKYPVAAPAPADEHPVKRPRGRPKGEWRPRPRAVAIRPSHLNLNPLPSQAPASTSARPPPLPPQSCSPRRRAWPPSQR